VTADALGRQAAELASLLSRLVRSISTFDENDPTMHLPIAQLRVCNILSDGPLTISALARELGTTVSAATQIADRLEATGTVERVPGQHDRRTKSLRLTDQGTTLLRGRRQRRETRAAAVLGEMSPAMRARVLETLRDLLVASADSTQASDGDEATLPTI